MPSRTESSLPRLVRFVIHGTRRIAEGTAGIVAFTVLLRAQSGLRATDRTEQQSTMVDVPACFEAGKQNHDAACKHKNAEILNFLVSARPLHSPSCQKTEDGRRKSEDGMDFLNSNLIVQSHQSGYYSPLSRILRTAQSGSSTGQSRKPS
jgi:hypothetical protein